LLFPQFPASKTLIICWTHSPTPTTNVCDTKHESTTRTPEGPAQHGPVTRTPTAGSGGIQPSQLTLTYSGQRNSRVPPTSNDKWNSPPDRQERTTAHHRHFGQASTRRNQDKAPTPALLTPRTTNPWKSHGLSHIYIHTHTHATTHRNTHAFFCVFFALIGFFFFFLSPIRHPVYFLSGHRTRSVYFLSDQSRHTGFSFLSRY
jgi:hypothetical protein